MPKIKLGGYGPYESSRFGPVAIFFAQITHFRQLGIKSHSFTIRDA